MCVCVCVCECQQQPDTPVRLAAAVDSENWPGTKHNTHAHTQSHSSFWLSNVTVRNAWHPSMQVSVIFFSLFVPCVCICVCVSTFTGNGGQINHFSLFVSDLGHCDRQSKHESYYLESNQANALNRQH